VSATPVTERQELVNRPDATGTLGTLGRTRWWLQIDFAVITVDP